MATWFEEQPGILEEEKIFLGELGFVLDEARLTRDKRVVFTGRSKVDPERILIVEYPSGYARRGDEELLPGDFVLEGEANHHRKQRGWTYWLRGLDPSGQERRRIGHKSDTCVRKCFVRAMTLSGILPEGKRGWRAEAKDQNSPRRTLLSLAIQHRYLKNGAVGRIGHCSSLHRWRSRFPARP